MPSDSLDAPDQQPGGEPRVIAVTVTYRRPELLPRLLAAVRAQTRRPDQYLLIDNGGEVVQPDGTEGWLEIVRTGENIGPAGGYSIGFRGAVERGADRIWVLDDDAIPDPAACGRSSTPGATSPFPASVARSARRSGSRGSAACSTRAGSRGRGRRARTTSSGRRTTSTCSASAGRARIWFACRATRPSRTPTP